MTAAHHDPHASVIPPGQPQPVGAPPLFSTRLFRPARRHLWHSRRQMARWQDDTAQALWAYLAGLPVSAAQLASVAALCRAAGDPAQVLMRPATLLDAQHTTDPRLASVSAPDLDRLIAHCQRSDLALALVRAAAAQALELPNPFGPGNARCDESLLPEPGLVMLRCVASTADGAGQQSFFLFQGISSADCLYFPQDHVLIYLAHARLGNVRKLWRHVLQQLPALLSHAQGQRRFGGVLASHSRPAHFYYETLPVLHALCADPGLAASLPGVFIHDDQDFNDLALLFPQCHSERVSGNALHQRALAQRLWFVHAGFNPHQRRAAPPPQPMLELLRQRMRQQPTAYAQAGLDRLAGCYPVVWIGLEGQKRCWLEQVEGAVHLITQLRQRFAGLGLVIDGWTLPLHPSPASRRRVQQDQTVARRLVAQLPADLRWVSVVGQTSPTKLVLGERIDFFITNFASGSLHVSHLLGKPGFCHLSSALVEPSLRQGWQRHPNRQVHLLPRQLVQDRPPPPTLWQRLRQRWQASPPPAPEAGSVSYSIAPADLASFVATRLDAVLAPADSTVLHCFLEPSFAIHPSVRALIEQADLGRTRWVFPTLPAGPRQLADLAGEPPQALRQQLLYGLFSWDDAATVPLPWRLLVWLDEPLRRSWRHALEFQRQAPPGTSLTQVLAAGHKALDNCCVRLLSGWDAPFGGCTEAMLARALHHLREHTLFIGLAEDLPGAFDRLCAAMDWDRSLWPSALPADFEPLPDPLDPDALDPDCLAQLNALTQLDQRLYAAAQQAVRAQSQPMATAKNPG